MLKAMIKWLFQHRDDGFVSVGSGGRTQWGLLGIIGIIPDRALSQTPPKWQDRRIIPNQRRPTKDLGVAHENRRVH
jgi:hypothetical protein